MTDTSDQREILRSRVTAIAAFLVVLGVAYWVWPEAQVEPDPDRYFWIAISLVVVAAAAGLAALLWE